MRADDPNAWRRTAILAQIRRERAEREHHHKLTAQVVDGSEAVVATGLGCDGLHNGYRHAMRMLDQVDDA